MQINDFKAKRRIFKMYLYENSAYIHTITIKYHENLVIKNQNFSTFMS